MKDADIIGDNRMIFNIRHDAFRLVVQFKYRTQIAYVGWVGTHEDYDKINPETV